MDIEGDSMRAPAYHPRALLSVWLYGFMTGVRSCRKLEAACRDQIPYLWLTRWQHPDPNTLWRFYKGHRQATRKLFERTVRTAVAMKLVDLAVQAVDGTKVVANASVNRRYDAEGLSGLLARLEGAIADLEAQNEAGEDASAIHLPEELADKEVLRDKVRQAMTDLASQKRHKRINLTDADARLMKGRQGIVAGYNAQAMVSAMKTEEVASGMLVTAVDVVDAANDNALLAPMVEQAEETTGTMSPMTLADAGYFAASHLAGCDRRGQKVVVSEARQQFLKDYGVERTLITDEGRVTIPADPETWIDIPFPAIVDADVWEQVQARKDSARRGPPGSAGTEFMLAKTVHCRCGSMMYTRTTRGRTPEGERIYRYYRCRGGESGERCRERVNVNAEALESAVWREARRVLLDPETALAGMEAVSGDEDVGELDARVRDAERDLREIQLEEERLLRLYVSGKITEEQLERQRRYTTERLEHAEAVLSGLGERRDAALDLGSMRAGFVEWAKGVREGLDSLSVQQRREIVRLVFSRIVLEADNDLTLTCAVVPGDVKGGSHGEDGR